MRKQLISALLFLAILPLFLSGCDDTAGPLLPLKTNELQATIADYGSFNVYPVSVSDAGLSFIIKANLSGSTGSDTLVVTLQIPKTSDTVFTVNPFTQDNARIDYCVQQKSGTCVNFDVYKGLAGSSGEINVTSVTSDGVNRIMEGTFHGVLVSTNGGVGAKTISDGAFKVKLP